MADTSETQPERNGNKSLRLRKWEFTWNNYTLDNIDTLIYKLKNVNYVFQEETGEKGTPHLQGYIEFKNARYLSALKKEFKGCYFEPCRNEEALIKYCQKDETRTGKIYKNLKEKIIIELPTYNELYKWQKEIVDFCYTKPDDRTIHWYWDKKGCSGKTTLIKYICMTNNKATFTCASKSADILTCADEEKNVYLINFSRTQEGFAPYNALEQLKDGLISDSKLKKQTRNIIMNSPHVIVFANWEPNNTALSNDRWKIINLLEAYDEYQTDNNKSNEQLHQKTEKQNYSETYTMQA